ncbi:MAG: Gfo/Idh/MocA family oxidoreductase [Cyanobacteria bacterium P01_C01_bin.89]
MAESMVRVAIAGTGFGQKIHLPGFQIHHRTTPVAIWNRDLTKAQKIATEQDIPHAFDDFAVMVAHPEVDAVSISTPPFLHFEMAKQALTAGKHILLEKPVTLSVEEARELQALAKNSGAIAAIDFEFRYVPAWQRFAELLAEEFVGKRRLIKIDWMASSRANPDRAWNWYALRSQGGGALGAIGSHAFDYISWLFGPVAQLAANLTTSVESRPDPVSGDRKSVDSDDICNLLMTLHDGTPIQMCLSSTTYQGRGHFVEVYGEKGTLILGSDNQKDYVHGFTLKFAPAGGEFETLEIPERLEFPKTYPDGRLAPFVRMVDAWVQGIGEGNGIAPSLEEGVYSQLLMDLTHKANDTKSWVTVDGHMP